VFQQPDYLETFIQSIFDVLQLPAGSSLVVGGDGRYYNREAIATIINMAAANHVGRIIIGQGGLLSTPAASHLIRLNKADAGIILTASHNPGGPQGDFGIKFNMATGGQAPEHLTEKVYEHSQSIEQYLIADVEPVNLDKPGSCTLGEMRVEIVDPVSDYAELMQGLFDFAAIRDMLAGGTRLYFDALNAATGPYARHIFCELLGAPDSSVNNAIPLEDFGGLHPDPNPADAAHLVELCQQPDAADLIAASDGDGDRNMILGQGMVVSPGDSLAIILANASVAPGYANAMPGVARSMPTSRAVDRVAEAMGVPCYETPTGWRFFSNLLDAGSINLCGEESFGTSSAHTGEKDGLWAVLFWLNMMAALGKPVREIVEDHWEKYGRTFFQRRDYFIADTDAARSLMQSLEETVPQLAGTSSSGLTISEAGSFSYRDPVDASESTHQGIRIFFENGGRIVYRLSGTGTSGATLRVYLDQTLTDPASASQSTESALQGLAVAAEAIADIAGKTGVQEPQTII
jgi:phosphoglucomutase